MTSTHQTPTVTTIDVCADCYIYAAYGEYQDDTPVPARVSDGFEQLAGQHITVEWAYSNPDEPDDGQHFSWQPCEICGDTDGGDRHPVTLIDESHEWSK